jgi:predicted DNA-binding protein (MmcQ/YjbR family)
VNIESFREYCLSKKGVTEEFPFDQNALVFKVLGKMFCLTDVNTFASVNLKCDPDKAVELREEYDFVRPGFHMNKTHWNTIDMVWDLDDSLFKSWIDHSYNLVLEKLTRAQKEELKKL